MKSCNNLSRNSVLGTLVAALLASVALLAPLPSLAQADSSSVPTLMRNGRVLPLSLQQRETPVVNNDYSVTQQVTSVTQVGGAVRVQSSEPYVSNMPDQTYGTCGNGNTVGQPGWSLACGSRACQSFGYQGGYVSEVALPDVGLICFR